MILPPLPPPSSPATQSIPPSLKTESNSYTSNLGLSLPQNYKIEVFAKNLPGARDLEFSPGGILLVSLTGTGKVVAVKKDGTTQEILSGLQRPHGLAFYQGKLFVAEETQVVRYNWGESNLQATKDKVLFPLPKGGNHFTRSLVFDKNGQLFVSIGSTCNVCQEKDSRYASIMVSDAEGNKPRIYANGLRNSVFMAINPITSDLWATDMGRDLIGDNIPPDEINIIKEGNNYGWPTCYGDRVHDNNFDPQNNGRCNPTIPPTYEIPAHSAPLGLVFINSPLFPQDWQGDLLVSYHGSWNRSTPTGYKVVHLKVKGNTITGAEDFLSGFLKGNQTIGRPVDVIINNAALYVSDDKAGIIYRITRQR